jgi:hypothetical protein
MKTSNPCLTAALEELAKAGIRHPEIGGGGNGHLQVRWQTASGQQRMVTMSRTPSDVNACHQTRRDVRRVLLADGMLEVTEPRMSPQQRTPSRLELIEQRLAAVERLLRVRA